MHTHSHGGAGDRSWQPPLSVRRILAGAVAVVVLIAVIGLVIWWPSGDALVDNEAMGFVERANGTVTDASTEPCSYDPASSCNVATVEITSGDGTGDVAVLEFTADTGVPAANLEAGDEIVLNDAGTDIPEHARYTFADFQRGRPIALLAIAFAAVVILVGRLRGLLALVGLVVSLGVVFTFILPALLRGSNPVGVALTGAAVISLAALYLAHGWNARTTIALLGTVTSLAFTGLLAATFSSLANLTGLANEESITLMAFAPDLDFRGLLLAAVIIGSLGVLDDVTVTQVSAVTEIRVANPTLDFRALYGSAVRVGRDHIASATNTLVLAYTAAALPLLLIFSQSGLSLVQLVTAEIIAIEVVQTLVGSIGLVCSVPITTAVAAWVATREEPARSSRRPAPA